MSSLSGRVKRVKLPHNPNAPKAAKWAVRWVDPSGKRRQRTFKSRAERDRFAELKAAELAAFAGPSEAYRQTVREYSESWLTLCRAHLKPRTVDGYRTTLAKHVLPVLGERPLHEITRSDVQELLRQMMDAGTGRATVKATFAVVRAMLGSARDDGLLPANPAERLGKRLRLNESARHRQEQVKAMTAEQLATFLAQARERNPGYAPLFLTLARTGMRLGEALALKWADVDVKAGTIRIERSRALNGSVDVPKSGHGRTVDLTPELADALRTLRTDRKREALKKGWGNVPEWVFVTSEGRPMDHSGVARRMKRSLDKAQLPLHFTPHCLRHTFASLLLSNGASVQYVQRQLGHASITLTVDTYGKWLPVGTRDADRLDAL